MLLKWDKSLQITLMGANILSGKHSHESFACAFMIKMTRKKINKKDISLFQISSIYG